LLNIYQIFNWGKGNLPWLQPYGFPPPIRAGKPPQRPEQVQSFTEIMAIFVMKLIYSVFPIRCGITEDNTIRVGLRVNGKVNDQREISAQFLTACTSLLSQNFLNFFLRKKFN
jgi:hypothetical protein